ncbi:MAG: sigma 54-interacting transcriptional regulator, partial [Myxococcales bacterium]|nr:sigma 54-interacting transcriptional regulator [Myxococcales bacterium]
MGLEHDDHPPGEHTAPLTAQIRELVYPRFRVEVIEGPDTGASAISEGEELSIGSAEGNSLVLQDRAASRHHCIISVVPRGFRIRDLDSTNGTRLAGFRVEAAIIKSGTVLGVGRSKLRFEGLPDHVAEPVSERASFGDLLGESAAMRRIFSLLPRIAASGSNVVIEGETGTGKTLLASAIHDASPRAEAPFVVVDCAALTPTLVESQLFGHRRGAFTGAHEDRPGAFVAARGGTVFLDEVGELPLDIQPKLLRVLEERTVVPVGETRPTAIDVRVVAATNRDLR